MESIIVGFGHKARNGKDEAVRTIIQERGGKYDIRRYAFADALKSEVNDEVERIMREKGKTAPEAFAELCIWASHLPVTNPDTLETKPVVVTYDSNMDMTDPACPFGKQRYLLQWWGTEYRRWSDSFYWVSKMIERLTVERPQFALITDMRFPNEAAWVHSYLSGRTVNVTRSGFNNGLTHMSEFALDEWDYHYRTLVADGDIESLHRDALVIFDHIVEAMKVDVSDPAEPKLADPLPPGVVVIDRPIKSLSWNYSTPDGVKKVDAAEVAKILDSRQPDVPQPQR